MSNTATYNGSISNLWNYLQGLSLSATDSRWLADRLIQNAETQSAKKLVFPHIDSDFKPSEKVLSRVLGPLPEGVDIDKELDLMWEERAK